MCEIPRSGRNDTRREVWSMNTPDENVLVVKRTLFDQLGRFQGLNFEPRKYLGAILSRGNNFFLSRAQAEKDPTHKQIIPYVLLTHGDKALFFVRGKKPGEQRLVAKGSIGNGGLMKRKLKTTLLFVENASSLRRG